MLRTFTSQVDSLLLESGAFTSNGEWCFPTLSYSNECMCMHITTCSSYTRLYVRTYTHAHIHTPHQSSNILSAYVISLCACGSTTHTRTHAHTHTDARLECLVKMPSSSDPHIILIPLSLSLSHLHAQLREMDGVGDMETRMLVYSEVYKQFVVLDDLAQLGRYVFCARRCVCFVCVVLTH